MPQTEDIEYIKDYEAYDCINASEDDDDFDPQDEPYEPSPEELQNMSQNPFTAKVFDPETMLFDLAEARKTETKFRESILSLMMSVLISSDKPNALLCGPAGCGKTKIVENRLVSEIKVIKRLRPELNIDTLFSADELAKAADKITADTYIVRSGARPAVTAVSKFIDSKLLSHFSRSTKTYRPNQN